MHSNSVHTYQTCCYHPACTLQELARAQGKVAASEFLKAEAKLPRRTADIPLQRGLLLFLLHLLWFISCIAALGAWGLAAAIAGLVATQSLTKRVVHHPRNRYALGVALWSIVLIAAGFIAWIAPYTAGATDVLQLTLACSTLYWLYKTVVADPGALDLRLETRNAVIKQLAVEEGADGLAPTKLCSTCLIVREPRSKHCDICGICVAR
jgi:hypothetical protein